MGRKRRAREVQVVEVADDFPSWVSAVCGVLRRGQLKQGPSLYHESFESIDGANPD